jgi:hypothetical protein
VRQHNGKNWKKVAEIMGNNKTDVQCLHRWQKVLNPQLVKGPWSAEARNSTHRQFASNAHQYPSLHHFNAQGAITALVFNPMPLYSQ